LSKLKLNEEVKTPKQFFKLLINKDKSFDERFDSVEMYRSVRDKIEAHIVR
jgi:hypothetical protein